MRKNLYEAFTLVEMLIVMGILIILMAVGITAGRFAINRANDVAHQNAVDQIYTALQAYYTDHREFPAQTTPQDLLSSSGELYDYMDQGTFNGGTEATYYYFLTEEVGAQSVLVCASLGGAGDQKMRGVYCNGNGFNDAGILEGNVDNKTLPYSAETSSGYYAVTKSNVTDSSSVWNGNDWGTAE